MSFDDRGAVLGPPRFTVPGYMLFNVLQKYLTSVSKSNTTKSIMVTLFRKYTTRSFRCANLIGFLIL